MKLRQINLSAEETPESILVEMTTAEAVFAAKLIGRMNDFDMDEVMHDGHLLGGEIYGCLTGAFFNKFWHSGVDEALEELTP